MVWDLCLPAKGRKQTKEKMPFKSAWKLSVVQAKEADQIISRVFGPIIFTISKWLKIGHMEKWLFLVKRYTKFSRLKAKSCALRWFCSLHA